MRSLSALATAAIISGCLTAAAEAEDLNDTSWSDLTFKGASLVFGRLEGQFDGPDFRSRKIRVVSESTGKQYSIEVGPGLGYFEGILPAGTYKLVGLEATYFPQTRPIDPIRFRPVRQRFFVRSDEAEASGPVLYIPADKPVYIGTIRAITAQDGLVYQGHHLRVFDEYDDAIHRLRESFPTLAASLDQKGIEPVRYFILKPTVPDSPLKLVGTEDGIGRARNYIAEAKYQQAINWLSTFTPTSDAEREEVRLLVGEAQLADGKYPEAIETLGDVLLADPQNDRALRLLARAHALEGDLKDAMSLYQGLAEIVPYDAEAHLQLGYLYALASERSLSAEQFASAFHYDFDYLLHDIGPFAMALRAVKSDPAAFEPPQLVRQAVPPPSSLQSRRASDQEGGLALLIDHNGKVVAAQVAPDNSGPMPLLMMAMIRATFKPAVLNGIPVPALLTMGGSGGGTGQQ